MEPTCLAAVALGAATVCLRLPRALSASFWQDEVASARVIQQETFGAMLHQVVRTESTPPLWYALAWATHQLGMSIHDTRLLSVVCDGILVGAVVLLAGRWLPPLLAATAGTVAAVSAQLSAHGRELRAYELLALLAVAFAFALERAIAKPTIRRLAPLTGVTAAGLMAHYFFVFTLAAALVWVAVQRRARTRVLLALGAGAAICAPWTPFFLQQYHADRYSWIGSFSASAVLATPTHLVSSQLGTPLVVVWLGLATRLTWRAGPVARLVTLLALGPILVASGVWASGVRIYATRNLIGTAPFLAVLLVAPLAQVRGRLQVTAATLVAGALVLAYATIQLRPDVPYQGIAQALTADGWHAADPIAVVGGLHALRSPLEWYLPHAPQLVPLRRLPRRNELVYAVLGAHSSGRAVARDRIRIGDFIVGRLPTRYVRRRGPGGLTLFTPRPTQPPRTSLLARSRRPVRPARSPTVQGWTASARSRPRPSTASAISASAPPSSCPGRSSPIAQLDLCVVRRLAN